METELLNQITNLVISLVIVLQITPWVLLLLGVLIVKHLERRDKTKPLSPMAKTSERR